MRKRNDATPVDDVQAYTKIFPYLMKRKCDSLVYLNYSFNFTNAVKFLKTYNKDNNKKIRIFELFLAAAARTIARRPKLNRFIANYEAWQRNQLSFNFVVKEDYSDESPEHNAVVIVDRDATLDEISKASQKEIDEARIPGKDNETDLLINKYLKLPKKLIAGVVRFFLYLDRKGKLPKAIRDLDGLHVSAFVANLGSISLEAPPLHHLYEWGTTSLFVTMGKMSRKRIYDENDEVYYEDTLDCGFTIDERIADGFYTIKSLKLLQEILNNPEQLLEKPTDLSYIPKDHKEYKQYRKRLKKEAKLNKKVS